jgi:heptosyltransferase-1
MRVLIIKTSSMGDVIHALPAISDAAARLPNVQFDWVVEEAFAEIPRWHGAVKTVIPVAIRRWRTSIFSRRHWQELCTQVALIRAHRYDCIVDAQGLIKSAVLTRLAQGRRCGMDYSSCREPLAALAYQQQFDVDSSLHAIERIRRLFALSLNYEAPTNELDYNIEALQWRGVDHVDPYVVFVHSASRPEKLWSIQQWVKLALKAGNYGYRVRLLWGNESERLRALEIADQTGSCQVMPRMNLLSIARLFQQSQAVVGVDTGLSHLAAAIGVPAVTLYFQTSPQLVGTRGQRQYCMSVATQHANTQAISATISADCVWDKLMSIVDGNQEIARK